MHASLAMQGRSLLADTFLLQQSTWLVLTFPPGSQVITSRMRQISNVNKDSPVRIVGLCTSLANAKDLGEWIGASAHGLFNFPPGPRPQPS